MTNITAFPGTPCSRSHPISVHGAGPRIEDYALIGDCQTAALVGRHGSIDFMPVRNGQSDLVRIVAGRSGRVTTEMELVLRFDYGESVPWVTRLPEGNGIRAIAGPDLFPQAFSHVAVVNSAMNLCERAKPARQRAEAMQET